jgi:hypothetical protein
MAFWGQALTAVGTIVAITPPTLAMWTDKAMERINWWHRVRYFSGTAGIIVGTLMQMYA